MMTIREYSEEQKVSYEAIRAQVVRYRDELSGHITVTNRVQYLDDWAIQFLNERRREHPVTVVNTAKNDEIDELKNEIDTLKAKIFELQEQQIRAQAKIEALKDEKMAYLEQKGKYTLFLEDYQSQKEQLREALIASAASSAKLEEVERSAEADRQRLEAAEAAVTEERERLEQVRSEAQANLEQLRSEAQADRDRLREVEHERDDAVRESQSYRKIFGIFYRKV